MTDRRTKRHQDDLFKAQKNQASFNSRSKSNHHAHAVLQMQRTLGNKAVGRYLSRRSPVQRSLETSETMGAFRSELDENIKDYDRSKKITEFMQDIGNTAANQLSALGIPKPKVIVVGNLPPKLHGAFSRETWTLRINQNFISDDPEKQVKDLYQGDIQEFIRLVYHELRHAEQYYRIAQYVAGKGSSIAELQTNLNISNDAHQETQNFLSAGSGLSSEVADAGMSRTDILAQQDDESVNMQDRISTQIAGNLGIPEAVVQVLLSHPETTDPLIEYISAYIGIPYAIAKEAHDNAQSPETASISALGGLININFDSIPSANYLQMALWYRSVYGAMRDYDRIIYQLIGDIKGSILVNYIKAVRDHDAAAQTVIDDIFTNWKDELIDKKLRPTRAKIASESLFAEINRAMTIDELIPAMEDAINKWNTLTTSRTPAAISDFETAMKDLRNMVHEAYENLRLESDAHSLGDRVISDHTFAMPST